MLQLADLWIEKIPFALLLTLVSFIPRAACAQQLEIAYGRLNSHLYRPPGTNVVYGDSNIRLVLGCMLPASSRLDQEKERQFLKWRKDENLPICGNRFFPKACEWEDFTFERGALVLSVQLNEYDETTNAVLGSGQYTCYHTENRAAPVTANVWVAGKYLEIAVNDAVSVNKTHQLPNKVARSNTQSFVLECRLGVGVKGLAPDTMVRWYKDTKIIKSSNKYVLDESGKRLEIRRAKGQDEGVYVCEADVIAHNQGSPIKTLQYVILQGVYTSDATGTQRRRLTLQLVLFIFINVTTRKIL